MFRRLQRSHHKRSVNPNRRFLYMQAKNLKLSQMTIIFNRENVYYAVKLNP